MNTTLLVDRALQRIESGATLEHEEILALADSPDILAAGMLADARRRLRHGATVTFLRVATCAFDALAAPPASASGGNELRLTGAPRSLEQALEGVRAARSLAGARTLAAFTWADVTSYAEAEGGVDAVLRQVRLAGLDALAEIALDGIDAVDAILAPIAAAGFAQARLHVAKAAPAGERVNLWFRVAAGQAAAACQVSVSPLPTVLSTI